MQVPSAPASQDSGCKGSGEGAGQREGPPPGRAESGSEGIRALHVVQVRAVPLGDRTSTHSEHMPVNPVGKRQGPPGTAVGPKPKVLRDLAAPA